MNRNDPVTWFPTTSVKHNEYIEEEVENVTYNQSSDNNSLFSNSLLPNSLFSDSPFLNTMQSSGVQGFKKTSKQTSKQKNVVCQFCEKSYTVSNNVNVKDFLFEHEFICPNANMISAQHQMRGIIEDFETMRNTINNFYSSIDEKVFVLNDTISKINNLMRHKE
jgi:hypothetical protein